MDHGWVRFLFWLPRIRPVAFLVGENILEWVVNLAALILIERSYGSQGLGTFAFLMAVLHIVGYLAQFGIPHHVEFAVASAGGDRPTRNAEIVQAGRGLFWTGAAIALVFAVTAVRDTTLTRVDDSLFAYIIIGLVIWFRNLGHLRIGVLYGSGRHEDAARQIAFKRVVFLILLFGLIQVHVPPSFLFLAYLVSEIVHYRRLGKIFTFPRLDVWRVSGRDVKATLVDGYRFLFTRDCLDIVIYLDFLILGLFVSSWKLGAYSEASIMAKFFLIIPIALRPVFRFRLCEMWGRGDRQAAARFTFRTSVILFTVNAVLALLMARYFIPVFRALFRAEGEVGLTQEAFSILLPGLLLFSAVTALGAVYEVSGRVTQLKRLVLSIGALNLLTNIYLVPYAGPAGAAAATSISLAVYFACFGSGLSPMQGHSKPTFFLATAGLYPVFVLMRSWDIFALGTFFFSFIAVLVLFYVLYFFEFGQTARLR